VLKNIDYGIERFTVAEMIASESRANYIRLTQEEMTGVALSVAPALRREFRKFRDFQGIVEANEHAVANITTVVRGRVVAVYVDLGQEVTTGQVLDRRRRYAMHTVRRISDRELVGVYRGCQPPEAPGDEVCELWGH
jgi:hypothetical protein